MRSVDTRAAIQLQPPEPFLARNVSFHNYITHKHWTGGTLPELILGIGSSGAEAKADAVSTLEAIKVKGKTGKQRLEAMEGDGSLVEKVMKAGHMYKKLYGSTIYKHGENDGFTHSILDKS